MNKILLVIVFITSSSFAQQWDVSGEMKHAVASGREWVDTHNGDIYIFGGYSDSTQTNVNWVQKFNIYNQLWELQFMKESRAGFVIDDYQNKAYIFGGIQTESENLKGLETWGVADENSVKSENINFNRVYSTGLIYNNNFYIIGGNPLSDASDSLPYIIEYNIANDSITYFSDTLFTDSDLPEQQMCTRVGDDIFIFGGVINGVSQKIFKFNTVDKNYTRLPIDLLEPRAAGRVIQGNDNKIYIIGGYNESNTALSSVEFFTVDDKNYSIENTTPLNIARSHFTTAYIDERIFVFGGYDTNGELITEIEQYYSGYTTNLQSDLNNTENFKLFQNFPNPFNPTTTIEYTIKVDDENLASSTNVTLRVYNTLGKQVADLVNDVKNHGNYKVKFDASELPSGVYFYRLSYGSFSQTKSMLLIK